MLIDANHPEQTRVVVVDGQRLLEFDTEIASQHTLRGNTYLAKVTRVEPSLQAAFVDYGGNRHGFLPFNEIHPDYYRVSVADRKALNASEAARRPRPDDPDNEDEFGVTDQPDTDYGDEDSIGEDRFLATESGDAAVHDNSVELDTENGKSNDNADGECKTRANDSSSSRRGRSRRTSEEDRCRDVRLRRSYTIQEVIKRGQIMLVQVVKEERGTKGAAVTTYLSLAGRYCVLMPNTARGGGISRKITNTKDRAKLKETVDSLQIPQGMAVIVRTAGIGRTKTEIKRDFDFLAKSWDRIRDLTLKSRAPALIYEESGLIKRTLRDTYTREIEEVLVQGEVAYREAKDFMKTLMPSHAKRVQPYKDSSPPLFHRFRIDAQLQHLHSPVVQLRSGGYLVINLTEALVAIDINSGRSTRERHIEETALKTNLEAADEIARQLRLRDLAGLVVIDFIDMDDRRNNSQVERRLKDALRGDRARVQVGRISPLGLLELSRQRLRPSLLETMMQPCAVCAGLGRVPSPGSSALRILAAVEDEGIRGHSSLIRVHLQSDAAFYILNEKRDDLARIERDYKLRCTFVPDPAMTVAEMRIEVVERREEPTPMDIEPPAIQADPEPEAVVEELTDSTATRETKADASDGDADSDTDTNERNRVGTSRRRRRRRSRKPAAPGIATFTRAATPLALHVAGGEQTVATNGAAHDRKDRLIELGAQDGPPRDTVVPDIGSGRGAQPNVETTPNSTAVGEIVNAPNGTAVLDRPPPIAVEHDPAEPDSVELDTTGSGSPAPNDSTPSMDEIIETDRHQNRTSDDLTARSDAAADLRAASPTVTGSIGNSSALDAPEPTRAQRGTGEASASGNGQSPASPPTPPSDRPRRRGWWQRLQE